MRNKLIKLAQDSGLLDKEANWFTSAAAKAAEHAGSFFGHAGGAAVEGANGLRRGVASAGNALTDGAAFASHEMANPNGVGLLANAGRAAEGARGAGSGVVDWFNNLTGRKLHNSILEFSNAAANRNAQFARGGSLNPMNYAGARSSAATAADEAAHAAADKMLKAREAAPGFTQTMTGTRSMDGLRKQIGTHVAPTPGGHLPGYDLGGTQPAWDQLYHRPLGGKYTGMVPQHPTSMSWDQVSRLPRD